MKYIIAFLLLMSDSSTDYYFQEKEFSTMEECNAFALKTAIDLLDTGQVVDVIALCDIINGFEI